MDRTGLALPPPKPEAGDEGPYEPLRYRHGRCCPAASSFGGGEREAKTSRAGPCTAWGECEMLYDNSRAPGVWSHGRRHRARAEVVRSGWFHGCQGVLRDSGEGP
jgi:hypothetical protein